MLIELIEKIDSFATVLVVYKYATIPDPIVTLLIDAGINVIGPVDRARVALSLAAQAPVDLALVGADLAGQRNGHELAETLRDTWGVPSVVLNSLG